MKPSEIRHIVFDIGRVLIHYDPELPFRKIIPDERRRQWFLAEVCSPAWNIEQDRGRSWSEAESELIRRFPQEESNILAFRRNWREMVPFCVDGTAQLMDRLIAEGHDVTLLTNFAADTFIEACALYPFLKSTRGVTVSGKAGLIKPDRAIYDLHANNFGLKPSACLFIDDSPHNVDGAIAAGWKAVQFTDAKKLRADLEDHGIPVN